MADLPSLAGPDGSFATGPHDVSAVARRGVNVTPGLGGNVASRSELPRFARTLGRVVFVNRHGGVRSIADPTRLENRHDPDSACRPGSELDSNPYSVLALRGGPRYVTDAGANDPLRLNRGDGIDVRAVFAPRMVEAPPFLGRPPGRRFRCSRSRRRSPRGRTAPSTSAS